MNRENKPGNAEPRLGLEKGKQNSQAGAWRSQGENDRVGAWRSRGKLWMREYWDRFIRDQKHFYAVVDYIRQNPVKARLCRTPEAWRWSSACFLP